MSDLFKDNRPELTEEEDRRLWQRVRTIPSEAQPPAPVPWWRSLWSMPAVRYGAPAFAVLLAAVVFVIEQPPKPTLRPEPARTTAAPAVPPTSVEVTRATEQAAPEPKTREIAAHKQVAAPAPREARIDQPAAADEERSKDNTSERLLDTKAANEAAAPPTAQSAPAPAPQAAALKKEGFAEPPKSDSQPQAKVQAKAPTSGATWGASKGTYRDGGMTTAPQRQEYAHILPPAVTALAAGKLPEPGQLADHPLLQAASNVSYALASSIPPPDDVVGGGMRYRVGPEAFDQADPATQAGVLAVALERALADPASVPRARIEAMLAHAKAIDARAGEREKPGTLLLVTMLTGALRAWPN